MPYPLSELSFALLLLAFLVALAYCYYVLYRIGRILGGFIAFSGAQAGMRGW